MRLSWSEKTRFQDGKDKCFCVTKHSMLNPVMPSEKLHFEKPLLF